MSPRPQPIIHIYKEVNKGKFKSVRHFELEKMINGQTQLSEKINLSKNQNFALSMPNYWLKIRQGKKWSKYITGLFKTHVKNIYSGDHSKRQNLLLFRFTNGTDSLIIYYYRNYFTKNLNDLLKTLELY